MAKSGSSRQSRMLVAPRMTQPQAMKSKAYGYSALKVNGDDAWALFEACARGELAAAKLLVAKDSRLVNAQYWYRFPVHLAVFGGHVEIVQLLLDAGADPGQSIYTYDSWNKLLAGAVLRGDTRIESLLRRAMRTRFNYDPDFGALKDAIIARDPRQIDAVVRRQPKLIRSSDALGNNAMHWSVITRQLNLIERFFKLGTPIDAERADGQTPVLLAVNGATDYWYRATRGRSHPSLRNTSVLVGSLLGHGASYTISVAAAVGDHERVQTLLAEDSGLARRLDSARVSPLSHAAREGHLHIVRLLLKQGADPNQPEDAAPHGRALFEACCGNHLEVAELLLSRGADPNAGVDSSECCLTIGTIYHGERARPLVQLLRRHGAYTPPYRISAAELKQAIRDKHPVTRHDEFFISVLGKRDLALLDLYLGSRKKGAQRPQFGGGVPYPRSPALVRRLLERGLDPNQPDWLGKTFLHASAENGDRSVAALLLAAGADINARDLEFQGTPLAAGVRSWCQEADDHQARRKRRMVEFLLRRGAAVILPDDQPWATPMAWAKQHGREDALHLLRGHGAS